MKIPGTITALITSTFIWAASGCGGESSYESEVKRFQGVWEFADAESDGVNRKSALQEEESTLGKTLILCEGTKVTFKRGASVDEFEISLDIASEPKQLSFWPKGQKDKERWDCIYKFVGDELAVCVSMDNPLQPPVEFTARKGTRQGILALQRAK